MTKKQLVVIQRNIRNAKETIEELACENYPFTEFCDPDLEKMFYDLNIMCITLGNKIDSIDG